AFIEPLLKDPRLDLRLNAEVLRITVADGQARGAVWRDAAGREHQAAAHGDVILAAGALVSPKLLMLSGIGPADHLAEHRIPSIQAFCVPIIYLDRDTRSLVKDTYGITITTVVVKPRSRGTVRLRSAKAADMPLVSPNLLKDPHDMATMIAGQRFFLRALAAPPLAGRVERIVVPDQTDLTD